MHTLLSALRALFVLGCLVVVPLMAVFGTSLPATLIAAISGQDTAAPAPPKPAPAVAASSIASPALPRTPLPSEAPLRPVAHQAFPATENTLAGGAQVPVQPSGNSGRDEQPTGNTSLPAQPPLVQPGSAAAGTPAVPSREKFSSLESRLQQLGVKFYRLETSGNLGPLFRFECQLPIAGNPAPPQMFEAIDSDPIQAVARVVHQVEDYRAGHWQ